MLMVLPSLKACRLLHTIKFIKLQSEGLMIQIYFSSFVS